MAHEQNLPSTGIHQIGLDQIRKRWFWFVALGILIVLLGTMALGSSVLMTLASMVFVGWLMVISGIAQALHGFSNHGWGGFFIDLLIGLLYAVAGFLIISHPAATAVTLTAMIATLLIFGGIFRIAIAATVKFHNRGWLFLNGLISVFLGISIWHDWPFSGLWVIGMFIGIDMIFNGWSLIMLGFAAKNLPADNA
ncbi:MAG: HdeD family acid-resistance protein [Planctomycetales bacterium]